MNQNEINNTLNNIANDNNSNIINDYHQPLNESNLSQNKTTHRKFAFSFIFLFFISMIEYIFSLFHYISPNLYSLSLWPVINKGQYYRIITHFFIHYGFFHLAIDLIILYYLLKSLEKIIGTMYTLCFLVHSMILSSIIFLLFMFVLKYLFRIFDYNLSINFNSEVGLSPLGFALHTFYFLFSQNKQKNINVLFSIEINGRYSPFFFLLFVYFFTPNRSFFGHLSGILSAWLIKDLLAKYIFPKRQWVEDMESIVGCFSLEFFYVNIINKDEEFDLTLAEMLTFRDENEDRNGNNAPEAV